MKNNINNDLTKEERDTILKDNKYLNKEFDMAEIFAIGNIPKFDNEADATLCAIQAGKFVRKNKIENHDNTIKYVSLLPEHLRVLFLKQLTVKAMEIMAESFKWGHLAKEIFKIA